MSFCAIVNTRILLQNMMNNCLLVFFAGELTIFSWENICPLHYYWGFPDLQSLETGKSDRKVLLNSNQFELLCACRGGGGGGVAASKRKFCPTPLRSVLTRRPHKPWLQRKLCFLEFGWSLRPPVPRHANKRVRVGQGHTIFIP